LGYIHGKCQLNLAGQQKVEGELSGKNSILPLTTEQEDKKQLAQDVGDAQDKVISHSYQPGPSTLNPNILALADEE